MISELDIWRAANLLIGQHGADAELEAARLQDLMLDRSDDEGGLCGGGSDTRLMRSTLRSQPGGTRAPSERDDAVTVDPLAGDQQKRASEDRLPVPGCELGRLDRAADFIGRGANFGRIFGRVVRIAAKNFYLSI